MTIGNAGWSLMGVLIVLIVRFYGFYLPVAHAYLLLAGSVIEWLAAGLFLSAIFHADILLDGTLHADNPATFLHAPALNHGGEKKASKC